ncbi:phosphoadenylyl-sulfate reductase [Synoicihabitans lomoniglobus]|uniref:Phosphoadenosine 5'-phosphosulfate reductase n=1 Tax=Synoicihabitans lomoniglobus TaxID=2909285 RepID=A0AAE9ZUT1_9BACT|nr:phosphoadenylyl-sulfate reductase [Opitutaceae bacterium LMO-M01]WED63434.1 phosphoadenylyl-sulfate reductase [Opitutaceae bacterium LMO-M01]
MSAATAVATRPSEPELEALDAAARVRWAVDTYGEQLILTTSFGVQSAVMLHLVTQVAPRIPVVFIDTGYLFPETYRFADELTRRLDLNLKVFNPQLSAARQEAMFGKRWERGEEELKQYNLINKVEPMDRAVKELGATAWLAGLRRSQASTREQLPVVQSQNKVTKIHPIIDWDNREVHRYLTQHDLPYHPLWEQGYVSLGDWHSTTPLSAGMSEEDTRFGGQKRECGLHEISGQPDFQI